MVLAPRHPQRFGAVAGLVEARGFGLMRASGAEFRNGNSVIPSGTIFLLDTIGDLARVYSLGAVAFVGGSLVPAGGHNPLEPAQFGVPVMIGSSFENFRTIVALMHAKEGIRVIPMEVLPLGLVEMVTRREEARALGERGRAVFESQAGATTRTVRALRELVERRGAPER